MMLCPLLVVANCILEDTQGIDPQCRKEECAWWEDLARKCAIKSLGAIAINMREIASIMEEEE